MESTGDELTQDNHIIELEKLIEKEINNLPKTVPKRPCIFNIPQDLRKVKKEAYTPLVVAIGPYHAKTERLKPMEPHKLRYLNSLLSRNGSRSKLSDYIKAIEERESEARKCYEMHQKNLDSQTFQRMMLLDGAFIVEFFCKNLEKMFADDVNFKSDWRVLFPDNSDNVSDPLYDCGDTIFDITWDLILLENQLPFFILEDLFDCTFPNINPSIMTFTEVACVCLVDLIPLQALEILPRMKLSNAEVKHFVDLMRLWITTSIEPEKPRSSLLMRYCYCCQCLPISRIWLKLRSFWSRREEEPLNNKTRHTISATELHQAGIRFKKGETTSLIGIRFDEANAVIEMPRLVLDGSTEVFFRNIMAYEVYHLNQFEVTNYMSFMDGLIDNAHDVRILEESNLIDNCVDTKKRVADIFNMITNRTLVSYSKETIDMWGKLTAYTAKPYNKWMAMLQRNYFGSPWAVISFVAALMLLGLTIVQTIASVRSTNWRGRS